METTELKSYLHQMIVETNDPSVLLKVKAYFKSLQMENESKDWWYTISEDEKKAIRVGVNEFEQGKGIAHRDVRKKIDLLLSKN